MLKTTIEDKIRFLEWDLERSAETDYPMASLFAAHVLRAEIERLKWVLNLIETT